MPKRGFTAAKLLKVGALVATLSGPAAKVEAVSIVEKSVPVYNFEVENTHTYFVGKSALWVHNACEGLVNLLRNVRFRGLIQNRPLSELTRHQTEEALRQAGLNPSIHFLNRLVRDPRTARLGVRTLNDLRQIFRHGALARQTGAGGQNQLTLSYGRLYVIVDADTGVLVSIVPR